MQNKKQRIEYLDGFRGIAILLVVLFHAFASWPKVLPYEDRFQDYFIFKNGYLGVQLFFLISGFVILMTLERSISLKQFLIKRWLRLFPGMLIATILIFSTAWLLPERPAGIPHFEDTFSGLLFINPNLLSAITQYNIGTIEGAFWSLYVETKFYIIFGILYFYLGKKKAIWVIALLYVITFLLYSTAIYTKFLVPLGFNQYAWFSAGCFCYLYTKNKEHFYLGIAITMAFLGCLYYLSLKGISAFLAILLISSVFILAVYSEKFQSFFRFKTLLFIGFISYPFYLIHENALIALTIKFGQTFPNFPALLMPLIPVIFLLAAAYIIAEYIEPITERIFISLFEKLRIYKK